MRPVECMPWGSSHWINARARHALYFWRHYVFMRVTFFFWCWTGLVMINVKMLLLWQRAGANQWSLCRELRMIMSQPSTQKVHSASAVINFKRLHGHTNTFSLQYCHSDICAHADLLATHSQRTWCSFTPQRRAFMCHRKKASL